MSTPTENITPDNIRRQYNGVYFRIGAAKNKDASYEILCFDCAEPRKDELNYRHLSMKPCSECGKAVSGYATNQSASST